MKAEHPLLWYKDVCHHTRNPALYKGSPILHRRFQASRMLFSHKGPNPANLWASSTTINFYGSWKHSVPSKIKPQCVLTHLHISRIVQVMYSAIKFLFHCTVAKSSSLTAVIWDQKILRAHSTSQDQALNIFFFMYLQTQLVRSWLHIIEFLFSTLFSIEDLKTQARFKNIHK